MGGLHLPSVISSGTTITTVAEAAVAMAAAVVTIVAHHCYLYQRTEDMMQKGAGWPAVVGTSLVKELTSYLHYSHSEWLDWSAQISWIPAQDIYQHCLKQLYLS